jgi:Ca2+-binding RTX toxin-like protein
MKSQAWAWTICLAAIAAPSAAAAATTINGTDTVNDVFCLADDALGGHHVRLNSNPKPWGGFPVTLSGKGGNDVLVINQAGACTCSCGTASSNFSYAGQTVTLNGDSGGDTLIGGAGGTTFLNGGDGNDLLVSYTSDDDGLAGGAGADRIFDLGGSNESIFGGTGNDCIEDVDCAYNSCDCEEDPGDNDSSPCAGAAQPCANCESADACTAWSCP